MSKGLTTIQGVQKRNGFLVYALVDKNFNQFIETRDALQQQEVKHLLPNSIPEHMSRITDMAFFCQTLTDDVTIKANGYKPIPDSFNIIACDNVWETSDKMSKEDRKYVKFIPKTETDIVGQLAVHETFHNTALFITGDTELLKIVAPYVDNVELTVLTDSPRTLQENETAFLKFPFEFYSSHFPRKNEFETKESKTQSKLSAPGKHDNRQVEEFGSMKMVTKVEKKSILGFGYKFVRFSR